MLIYEITATVDAGIAAEYEKYMTEQHIPDLLATGHFAAAFFAKKGSQYRIAYHADSQQQLDDYLANDAERLRAEFAEQFPEGIEIARQNLEIIALFSGTEREA
ncbi:MAG: DUF4286 family protein [Pyrinomonadaceae bacterium]